MSSKKKAAVPTCLRCGDLGYINPSPFNMLFNCPDCKGSPELPELTPATELRLTKRDVKWLRSIKVKVDEACIVEEPKRKA